MSDRIIRDELLTSERYWSCSPEARNMYVSILLSADDSARYTASNFALRTKCMAGTVSAERIDKLLTELVDVDLVRLYEVDGARYLFVPRYRQRLRFTHSRFPPPPNGISDLTEKKTDSRQSQARLKTAEVKRSEEKRRTTIALSEKISLSADGVWESISPECLSLWKRAYPALSLETELSKAAAWIKANPKNIKKNYARFLNGWLQNAQDRAPRVDAKPEGFKVAL